MIVTLVAALLQGTVGLGFAMVSVPVLSLVHPALAPVPQLLVIMPMTVAMAWRERRHLDLDGVGWVLAGRLPGAALGVALLAVATQATLDLSIGLIVLLGVAILASGYHVRPNRGTKFGAGVLSGITGLVASIGGPPLGLLYSRESGGTVRSSLAAVFTVGLLVTLVARGTTGHITTGDVRVAAALFPAMVAGYLLSGPVRNRVDGKALRVAILLVSTAAALGLLVRAFS